VAKPATSNEPATTDPVAAAILAGRHLFFVRSFISLIGLSSDSTGPADLSGNAHDAGPV